jgi:Cysteine sulfinate desulfinase/cysteine desulfurase and related enzymes
MRPALPGGHRTNQGFWFLVFGLLSSAPGTIPSLPALPIYLDHHATTPVDPDVLAAMLPFFSQDFGNPASASHEHGRRAARALEDARILVARFFTVQPQEVYFTAGATESNNLALHLLQPGEGLVTSAMEHKSILVPAAKLARRGVEVTILQPDGEGFVSAAQVGEAIRPNTRLVSIETANSEIGTIQPIEAIGAICRARGVVFHTDATQAAGKISLPMESVDLASISAHKLYGPKGIGALIVRRGIRMEPVIDGGGQERGVRSGTVNVPAVVGLAEALRISAVLMGEEAKRLASLRDRLWGRLTSEIDGVLVHGPRELRLPGNLNASFERVDAESIMIAMRNFSLSAGSACSSGEPGPSPVLKAIGVSDAMAFGAIRFGLGRSNTMEHIELLVGDLTRTVRRLREISPA